jgi:hypothetical protein
MAEWVVPIVTSVIAAVAVFAAAYYTESFPRRVRGETELRVAERQFDAYASLWALTKPASPMSGAELDDLARRTLFDAMTDWYYHPDGRGMLLSEDARNIYLKAKRNLTCTDTDLEPSELGDALKRKETTRSELSKQQLSLLRTAIRADLRIFTKPYGPAPESDASDEARARRARARSFLVDCPVKLTKRPWRDAFPPGT